MNAKSDSGVALTDEATICAFMEPGPYSRTRSRDSEGGWWRLIGADRKTSEWEPTRYLTLDRLHEVEQRLTDAQCSHYDRELADAKLHSKPTPRIWFSWHSTADQKIKALAVVIRAAQQPHAADSDGDQGE